MHGGIEQSTTGQQTNPESTHPDHIQADRHVPRIGLKLDHRRSELDIMRVHQSRPDCQYPLGSSVPNLDSGRNGVDTRRDSEFSSSLTCHFQPTRSRTICKADTIR